MKSSVFFQTKAGNHYFYNSDSGKTMFCHPKLSYAFRGNINNSNDSNKKENYYEKKISFLLKHGIISVCNSHHDFRKIKSQEIEMKYLSVNQIIFEITEKCNLKCTYCTFGDKYNNYDHRNGIDLDVNSAIALLEHLKISWSTNSLIFKPKEIWIKFFGGEPLLNIKFIKKILKYIKKNLNIGIKFKYIIITNAILIKKHINYLSKNDIKIQISVDGTIDDNVYRLFPNGKYAGKKIIDIIDYLKNEHFDFFEKNVSFNAVLHNKNSIESIYTFLSKRYHKLPRISELHIDGLVDDQGDLQFITNNFTKHKDKDFIIKSGAIKQVPDFMKLDVFVRKAIRSYVLNAENLFIGDKNNLKKLPTGTCTPFLKLYLTAQGNILPCEGIGYQFKLGEIINGKVNIDFVNIAKQYNIYFNYLIQQCQVCFKVDFCDHCVFFIDKFPNETKCPEFKNIFSIKDELSKKIDILETSPKLYWDILDKKNQKYVQ